MSERLLFAHVSMYDIGRMFEAVHDMSHINEYQSKTKLPIVSQLSFLKKI